MAVSLLLIGMSGNGKSSTCNSILGRKIFTSRSSSQPCIEDVLLGSSVINGKNIHLVDGPGIGNTNFNDSDDVEKTIGLFETALRLSPLGFNAVIIVFKYGVRFTTQEKNTVSMIKDILGDNVIKDHGVIVFTYGDRFFMDTEEEDMSFEVWCQRQSGGINDLFNECGHRYVLFNNRTIDQKALTDQRDNLLAIVENLQRRSGLYSWTNYIKAEDRRKKILVTSKLPLAEAETTRVLKDVDNKLSHINVNENSHASTISKLAELQVILKNHNSWLRDEEAGTGVMKALLVQVGIIETRLNTKMDLTLAIEQQRRMNSLPVVDITSNERDEHSDNAEVTCWFGLKSRIASFFGMILPERFY